MYNAVYYISFSCITILNKNFKYTENAKYRCENVTQIYIYLCFIEKLNKYSKMTKESRYYKDIL